MEQILINRIKERYFRKVMAFPEGAVVHYGDCHIFSDHICTCGLLSDLIVLREPHLIYGKYYEDYRKQDQAVITLCDAEERKRFGPIRYYWRYSFVWKCFYRICYWAKVFGNDWRTLDGRNRVRIQLGYDKLSMTEKLDVTFGEPKSPKAVKICSDIKQLNLDTQIRK